MTHTRQSRPDSGLAVQVGGVPREQKMLKGHLPRVTCHQVYQYTKIETFEVLPLRLDADLPVRAHGGFAAIQNERDRTGNKNYYTARKKRYNTIRSDLKC